MERDPGGVRLGLLNRARTSEEIRAALEGVPRDARLRATLVERYDALAAAPRRDPAARLRAELLNALRPLVTVEDRERVEAALTTYEFGPLGENCSGLRAAALLCLAELDPDAAELHSVHLLGDGDRRTEKMSGQPALTATEFLVSRGQLAPVYLYALAAYPGSEDASREPLAAALRNLAPLPAALALDLARRHATNASPAVLVGLFDLLIGHDQPEAFSEFVRGWARETDQLDVLDFALAEARARHRTPLVEALETGVEERLRGALVGDGDEEVPGVADGDGEEDKHHTQERT
ncbi:MAG TPA: hypothetical protein VF160_08120 [Candidatus Dormibacteraeota bacterium]